MKEPDQVGVDDSMETLRPHINKIIADEATQEEETKHFPQGFDVGDLTTDDLDFYMKFKSGELTTEDVADRQDFLKRVSGSPSQMQLFFYIVRKFKAK